MSWISGVLTALVVAYLGFFSYRMFTLLNPQYFISPSDYASGSISPAWQDGSSISIKAEVIAPSKSKTLDLHSNILNFSARNTDVVVINSINLVDVESFLMPKSKVRFVLQNLNLTGQSSTIAVEVPLVLMRPIETRASRIKPKYHLVAGWPIIGSLYPRNATQSIEIYAAKFLSTDNKRAAHVPPRLTMFLVADWTRWPATKVPDHVGGNLRLVDSRLLYFPLVSAVQMGVKRSELIQINSTANNRFPPLEIQIGTMSLSRWAFYALMEESFSLHRKLGMMEEKDLDDVKSLLTENTAELLVLTMVISILHMLFDMLAFKSEIGYWRRISSAEGVSVRSTTLNLISQLIVALYLREQEASALVVVPAFISTGISAWKAVKLLRLRRSKQMAGMEGFASTGEVSAGDHEEADATALKYMGIILVPVVLGYSFLTLVRDDHTSWFSWFISSMASSVYAGGFALMTPQIFLNYRLKSVAHLDWTALSYRAFNTFIDDFFAYLIPMPGLARMAVLRDDLIFIIFLYQRWIYPSRNAANKLKGD